MLQLGCRVQEVGTAGQGQAAEQLGVVQEALALPVPLLELHPGQERQGLSSGVLGSPPWPCLTEGLLPTWALAPPGTWACVV